jgi:hypothetical protein
MNPGSHTPVSVSFRRFQVSPHRRERRVSPEHRQNIRVSSQPTSRSIFPALRRTLRDGRDGNRFIINVPGRGYTFVASVEVSGRENRVRTAFATPLTPAGSSWTIVGGDASRLPTANERQGARHQGRNFDSF